MNEFEKKVQQQPMREIPADWRQEILAAAKPKPTAASHRLHWFSMLQSQIAAILWPAPKAWGALAAVWVAVIASNLATDDSANCVLAQSPQPNPKVLVALKQRQLLILSELSAAPDPVADRPRSEPQPRSEYQTTNFAV